LFQGKRRFSTAYDEIIAVLAWFAELRKDRRQVLWGHLAGPWSKLVNFLFQVEAILGDDSLKHLDTFL
jgi:hypothetical protein